MIRRRALLTLSGAALGAAALGLATWPRRARAQGERPYDTLDLEWQDTARERAVPARLYLPQAEGPRRAAPLVVFSHGIGGSRFGYQYLGRHWAAHGWASLHLQHIGSDRSLWGGNPLQTLVRLREAASDSEAIARAHDLRFALDTALADPQLGPRLDGQRIVAAGHSYGANTAMLASGARVVRRGRVVPLADARVRAALLLSAPPFYGEDRFEPILGGITLPSLHVTATADDIRIPGYESGVDDRIALFEAIGGRPKALAVFEGGSHSIFTDRSGPGGPVLNAQVKEATRELTLAFLRQVFDGDAQALQAWPQRHAAIVARFSTLGG